MKTSVVTGACWVCAVLDLLSALSLPRAPAPAPAPSRALPGGAVWDKPMSRVTVHNPLAWRRPGRPGEEEEEERRRHIRALEPAPRVSRRPYSMDGADGAVPSQPGHKDVRDSEVLQYLERLIRSRPENCTSAQRATLPLNYAIDQRHLQAAFQEQVKKAVQLANVMNSLFLYPRRPADPYKNLTYYALTHSLVQNDPKIKGCGIAFTTPGVGGQSPSPSPPSSSPPTSPPPFFPYSYRAPSGATVVTNARRLFRWVQQTSWRSRHERYKDASAYTRGHPTVFANHSDVGMVSAAGGRGFQSRWNRTVRVSGGDGVWGGPHYSCALQAWILHYSLPFFQGTPNGSAAFRGEVLVALDLSLMEVNQCDRADPSAPPTLFAGTHRCRQESTKCVPTPGQGLRWGSYECVCKPEFYFPDRNATNRSFHGRDVELAYLDMVKNSSLNYTEGFMCAPCRKGCEGCEGDEPCIVEFHVLLRGIPLGVQSFCMTIALVVGIVIIRLRKTKVMRSSVWVLLEMIILGALLIYATVIIQYFEPTATNCLLVPWFREVGFAMLYGTLVLKTYRILAEFQSRKAHRVHVRDKDLFKSLALILVVVIGYMAAWTAVNMDHVTMGTKLIHTADTEDGLSYVLCKSLWWDYAIEIAEVLFLVVGVYLCYCVRSAPSDFSERRCVTGAITYELGFSLVFYVCKHMWWMALHPDHLFLLYFVRCQLTITFNLLMLLGPKLWYAHRPPDDDRMRTRAYSQSDVQDSSAPETMKLNVGISSNGDVDVGEISLTEMDPEDIRAELKRLYTQLQIYKTKTMRKDNPHISKRRGGRKQTHRRFSLQAFHHKHRHHHEHEHEHEMSKTPEESTNSAEAVTFPMEPSVKEEPNEGGSTGGSGSGRNPPSVSFKPGHT